MLQEKTDNSYEWIVDHDAKIFRNVPFKFLSIKIWVFFSKNIKNAYIFISKNLH